MGKEAKSRKEQLQKDLEEELHGIFSKGRLAGFSILLIGSFLCLTAH